jgi:L-gulonate 3-dehydrogenase
MTTSTGARDRIAIMGAGSIGVGWAIVFAGAGHGVALQDPQEGRLAAAASEIAQRLADLQRFELIDEAPAAILARLSFHRDPAEAMVGVRHVQECAPEDLELKRRLFAELDRLAPTGAVLASSSSFLPASAFAATLPGRERCLVVHPGNPPYLLRIGEIVPAPFTAPAAADRAAALLAACGVEPIRLHREVDGFVFNRLQGALLREAYCLVRDGVAEVEDVDRILRDGLGLRWSVIGPFETADLNQRGGIEAHARRMGPAYERLGAERGQHDPWSVELVAKVAAARRAQMPLDQWESRVAWRDRALMAMLAARRAGSAM